MISRTVSAPYPVLLATSTTALRIRSRWFFCTKLRGRPCRPDGSWFGRRPPVLRGGAPFVDGVAPSSSRSCAIAQPRIPASVFEDNDVFHLVVRASSSFTRLYSDSAASLPSYGSSAG